MINRPLSRMHHFLNSNKYRTTCVKIKTILNIYLELSSQKDALIKSIAVEFESDSKT